MDELMTKETMSSLQIAEISGKHHKDVMRAIRKMEPAWEKICGRKFALTSQIIDMPNGGTRKESCYILNKTECLFIATKFNDEARAKLVIRWEELERNKHKSEISLPDFSNPAEAARAWAAEYEQKQQLALENKRQAQELEVKDAQITELNTAVSEMQPKVSYVDTILQCKDTVQTTIIAQDYGKSAKAFNILLRNFGIQRKVGTAWGTLRKAHSKRIRAVKDLHLQAQGRNGRSTHILRVDATRAAVPLRHLEEARHPADDRAIIPPNTNRTVAP